MHELFVIHWVLHVLCMGDLSFVGLFLFLDYLIVVTCMQRVLSVEADVLWVYLLFTTYSLLLTLYYLLFTTLCRSRCAVGVYDIGAAWVSRPSTRELLQYYLLFTT